jgi:F0F1-type ATP synthase membrane subunit c/vacuolar-type H+-ATPase subunit K
MLEYATLAVAICIFAGAYAMAQGGIINASADMEGKSTPWGAGLTAFGGFTVIVGILLMIVLIFGGGGEGEMIPESAWPLLTGSLTLIGAAFASALCIMVAAKAGADMLIERPELSIWSLLFIALGEGLAIYGLIIAILLSSG